MRHQLVLGQLCRRVVEDGHIGAGRCQDRPLLPAAGGQPVEPAPVETITTSAWAASLVTSIPSFSSVPSAGPALTTDQVSYNATVVVFFGRDFGLPQAASDRPSERVLRVQNSTGLHLGNQ